MNKYKLETPYIIKSFDYHKNIKENLIELVNQSNYTSPEDSTQETKITRADWHNGSDMSRDWVKFLVPKLTEEIMVMYEELGFDKLTITEIWFQQYLTGSKHGWHTHSGNWTNVYYLEFPEGSPKTILINPFDKKSIIEVDVKEGDLLVFPAFVMHKAPINTISSRKTIISYNINSDISDLMYKKWMP